MMIMMMNFYFKMITTRVDATSILDMDQPRSLHIQMHTKPFSPCGRPHSRAMLSVNPKYMHILIFPWMGYKIPVWCTNICVLYIYGNIDAYVHIRKYVFTYNVVIHKYTYMCTCLSIYVFMLTSIWIWMNIYVPRWGGQH
jgi:hypothetical protein